MMKKLIRKALPILLLFFFSLYSTAQNEANVWYFGKYAGIDFNTGTPIPLIGFTGTVSAASSICDSTGNFLMFSDGQKIWNADSQIMLNGDDLVGHHMSTQGALILQKPGSTNLYYVFTVGYLGYGPSTYGLHYSILDITLDNGKGGVTTAKNILLNEAWDAFEKLTAVKHPNGTDIWVITRKSLDDAYAAFLLTPDGINETPAISAASHSIPLKNVRE